MTSAAYDVIIIGTGAGGGTLAQRLAPSGKRILILERGGFIPRERENWDAKAVFTEGRYTAKDRWLDRSGEAFSPYTHYCVGGNTKVYGAALLRMRESDFGEVRHYGGISPAWPISYDDLEPHYTEAERLYSVHGARGEDPFDPPTSAPYPHGPLDHEPRIAGLLEDFRAAGLRPFPLPIGLRLPDGSVRSAAPAVLANFDGYPDPTEVKADAHVVGVAAALAHSNVDLVTGAFVERLDTDASGRVVEAVLARIDGDLHRFAAGIVVVACGAINSAALLLRSASGTHPAGLANSSEQVGRNLMLHNNGLFIAYSESPNPSIFQKTFGVTDFYRAGEHGDFPLGTIQLMGRMDLDSLRSLAKDRLPGTSVERIAAHSIDFFLTAEDLPRFENRVTLTPEGGIRVSYTENNLEAYDGLRKRLENLLDDIDRQRGRRTPGVYLHAKLGVSGVSHQCGTLRFGRDPKTSVLDTACRAHDVDNLYVADSSFFCSSGAVNPSLTIMANALRVGDAILDRLN